MHKVNWAKTEKYHCLFCGCLVVNLKGKAESYQLEGGLECVQCCWGEREGFISLLWNRTGCPGVAEAEQSHGQVCLCQPIPVRLHMESHMWAGHFSKVTWQLLKNQSVLQGKPSPASFPSCLVFRCLTRISHGSKAAQGPAPGVPGTEHPPVPAWAQQLLKGEAPPSLSMESSSLKLFKINTGIGALHSPQTTFALKWNCYLFSVWIFWWVFLFCSLLPKDWVFLCSRRVHAHNHMQVPMCNFYLIFNNFIL